VAKTKPDPTPNANPDSSLRYRRYINHLLTYLLTNPNPTHPTNPTKLY